MAVVTAALVKELRERTGLGMMECKKALVAAEGDIERAIDDLRKSGQAAAAKKAGRVAAEGVIAIATSEDNKLAVMVEINSETDFVARDESFLKFADSVAQAALEAKEADVEKIAQLATAEGPTVEEARNSLVQQIGENIQVRRAGILNSDSVVGSYVHGGKIGVLVSLEGGNEEVARDVAMHVAAINPTIVTADQVDPELLEREKEIIRAQPDMEGKPAEIMEKMVQGRVQRFLKEISLVDQPFVKDPSTSVGEFAKKADATVQAFVRLEVGEGIEKEEEDFAAEVMAQLK
ncbi:MAG TPA: translation elongation factor Ts [Alcanivoracaceae bacterium]|nr:translation elongation factor Ts [Alcanivoracaceae bacterium]